MSEHKNTAQISSQQHVTCIHCHRTFKSERSLAEHTVKNHQKFSASVSYKIHQCTKCPYKTIFKTKLSAHIVKHTNPVTYYKPYTCIHCNATFTSKSSLDDHIVRKHPEFMESVLGKIHSCTLCSYKSTRKSSLTRHMVKHPETQNNRNVRNCIHCNATFKTKQGLDEHIVKKHPDLIASLSRKIYSCEYCPYLTITKTCFTEHMLRHPSEISVI
nr:unnamed protein product [Callosobruchus chinensis]